jgi:ATP-dependent Lon protease
MGNMEQQRKYILHLYRKVLFPYCGLSAGVRLRFVHSLKPGDRLLVYPVGGILDMILRPRSVATLAEVVKNESRGHYTSLQLKGLSRCRIEKRRLITNGYYRVIEESAVSQNDTICDILRKKAQELIFLINVDESDKLIHLLNFISDLQQLTDFVANYFVLQYERRYSLLNETDVMKRAHDLLSALDELIDEVQQRHKKETV